MTRRDSGFAGTTAVVTGGTSGIGGQLAADLVRLGARVTVCSDNAASVSSLEARTAPGSSLTAEVCDVRSEEAVTRFARRVEQRYGHVDLLVNNAGYTVYRPFEESAVSEILDILDVNLAGAMRCARAFLPGMIARRDGRILNVSSVAGYFAVTPNATYCAAKHGLVGWTKALNYELDRFNVWVGVLCPDHVKTGFQDHPTFQRREPYRTRPERLTVEEVSAAALDAIERRRTVTFVPRRAGLVAWAMRVLPGLAEPMWRRLMLRRVEQLYDEMARESTGPSAGRR